MTPNGVKDELDRAEDGFELHVSTEKPFIMADEFEFSVSQMAQSNK